MRFKKTIGFLVIVLVIFLIYIFVNDNRINYVVLGDSVALGVNPYGEVGYSYTDYIRDYLDSNNRLKSYIKDFAVSGYTTRNILDDLYNNKEVSVDDITYNIRHELREADLVTISIGANDFIKDLSLNNLDLDNIDKYKEKVDEVIEDIDLVLSEVRKYAKKDIVVVGYYNPFTVLFNSYESSLDKIFKYIDLEYFKVCSKYSSSYISLYSLFKDNPSFLSNPFDIHPNLNGYKAISQLIINEYFS